MSKSIAIKLRSLGRKIASIRKAKNMTQKELAECVGCNKKTIENIEAGGGGRIHHYMAIKQELNTDELFI